MYVCVCIYIYIYIYIYMYINLKRSRDYFYNKKVRNAYEPKGLNHVELQNK